MEETICLAQEEECELNGDVEAMSLKLTDVEQKVDVKSKIVANLEALSTISPNDVKELEMYKQFML